MDPYLGEIRLMSFSFAPRGWALCDGQTLAISQNQALFSLLGTTYGGNGTTMFALPDLRGRVPAHVGTSFQLGQRAGSESVALTASQMPAHTHAAQAVSAAATTADPSGALWAATGAPHYGSAAQAVMAQTVVANAGGAQPHPNMPPFLVLSFAIATAGIYPSRS